MKCSVDIDCVGRMVCSANHTCRCISSGYDGPNCTDAHPSLILDSFILTVVMVIWIAMCIRLSIDLSRFYRFRQFLLHVPSSFFTTVALFCSTAIGILWVSMDMACTFNASKLVTLYDIYKGCGLAIGSSGCFAMCVLFGYIAMMNVILDWLAFLASAYVGGNSSFRERLPKYRRIVRLSQSVYAFGLLAFLVSLRFDLLVLWNLPFTIGLLIVYCFLGQSLIKLIQSAENTVIMYNHKQGLHSTPQQASSDPPAAAAAQGSPAIPSSDGFARQLTSPMDKTQTNSNNTPGAGLARQMTLPMDTGAISLSSSGEGGGVVGHAMGRQMTSLGDAASDLTSASQQRQHGPQPPPPTGQVRFNITPTPTHSEEVSDTLTMLLRRTMKRIQITSLSVSFFMMSSIAFAFAAFLIIAPHTSFQYELGGWSRPGYWFFRASMVCITLTSLSLIWYVHSNNNLFVSRMSLAIRQARVLNDAGMKEQQPIDSFTPSLEGTTLGRAEGSTVIAIHTVDTGTVADNRLLARGEMWMDQQPQTSGTTSRWHGSTEMTYVEESIT